MFGGKWFKIFFICVQLCQQIFPEALAFTLAIISCSIFHSRFVLCNVTIVKIKYGCCRLTIPSSSASFLEARLYGIRWGNMCYTWYLFYINTHPQSHCSKNHPYYTMGSLWVEHSCLSTSSFISFVCGEWNCANRRRYCHGTNRKILFAAHYWFKDPVGKPTAFKGMYTIVKG